MSKLSDDYGTGAFRFTGAFCGICAQDLRMNRIILHKRTHALYIGHLALALGTGSIARAAL